MKSDNYPVAFYFQLSFVGEEAAFQEVSGIAKELNIEEVVSGGENRFKYRLPVAATNQNLVLKRAMKTTGSQLLNWCASCIDQGLSASIATKDVTVSLLNAKGNVCMSWTFYRAYPVKYSVSNLNSQETNLVIESIELAYTYFQISPVTTVTNLFL